MCKATREQLNIAHRAVNWLQDQRGIYRVYPCLLSLGKSQWPAARYLLRGTYTKEMDAVRHGLRRDGEAYYEECVYAVGDAPKRVNNTCYTLPGDRYEWYLSGYIRKIEPQFANFHPLGVNFCVRPWSFPIAIDAHEPKRYNRVPMVIEYL